MKYPPIEREYPDAFHLLFAAIALAMAIGIAVAFLAYATPFLLALLKGFA